MELQESSVIRDIVPQLLNFKREKRAFVLLNSDHKTKETYCGGTKFIIPAKDHQGHTERGWFHMPPPVDRALEVVLREHHFPFRTKGDVIRWCVVTGLKMLEKLMLLVNELGKATKC